MDTHPTTTMCITAYVWSPPDGEIIAPPAMRRARTSASSHVSLGSSGTSCATTPVHHRLTSHLLVATPPTTCLCTVEGS